MTKEEAKSNLVRRLRWDIRWIDRDTIERLLAKYQGYDVDMQEDVYKRILELAKKEKDLWNLVNT